MGNVINLDLTKNKVAIVFNKCMKNYCKILQFLEEYLIEKNIHPTIMELNEIKYGYDFVFAIGGDGTILHVAKFYAKTNTPVLGINLGRLGFLSQICSDNITNAIDKITKNGFYYEKRIMLEAHGYTALNDFVIKGLSSSRTARFLLKINDKFVCDYIADGIIVSTPTGSTAYGLSAGGPVLYPLIDALVIVPICPHTLTARPLVVPASEKITIESPDEDFHFTITADGTDIIEENSYINIVKSEFQANLALLEDTDFYTVLREKLHWGVAPYN